ncbi:hypothetical protein rerp_55680 [Rhodococcus erythropolis]|nr:hypothetical protein rerp_55680 [Rhodococcus erythropolis]
MVDAQLLLDCHRGQADLAAYDDGTRLPTDFIDAALDSVGSDEIVGADQIAHRCAGSTARDGGCEAVSSS